MAIRQEKSLGEKLQSLPKPVIYLLLILATTVPLFFDLQVPNKPVDASIDFYAQVMQLQKGDRILLGSDWTNSTRGESSGEFEALLKILMRRGVKFAVYSTGDVQAPQVAKDSIRRVNRDIEAEGGAPYKPFEDYVVLGFFPNSEGTNTAINNNIRQAFSGRKDSPAGSSPKDVLTSPVFEGIKSVSDFKMLILATASSTNRITVERVTKTPLMFMVTGVMVPESQNYYASGQILGLVGGIKGVYDLEMLMENGVAPMTSTDPKAIKSSKYPQGIEGFKGKRNAGKGTGYSLALHFAIGLLIIAVIVGNVGMFLARRKGA